MLKSSPLGYSLELPYAEPTPENLHLFEISRSTGNMLTRLQNANMIILGVGSIVRRPRSLQWTKGLSLMASTSKSAIAENFFARNAPWLTEKFEKIKEKKQFPLSCRSADVDSLGSAAEHSYIPFDVSLKTANATPHISTKKRLHAFYTLTKPPLTMLVTLSAVCSYALSPYPATVVDLLCLTAGTWLCSGAANAINMAREPEFDKQMPRTSTRPVVRGLVKPNEAYQFSGLIGSLGVLTLYVGVNPTVAALGALNIVLYSWIYTSLKRKSILNTWVGAIVGAIPPLMGWAAASQSLELPGAWCLAALLYAWQFPHFNSLSHNIKDQYKQAGYVMTAFENPRLNARVAFRYALLMFPICFGLSYFEVTDWYFQGDSFLLNAWLAFLSYKFWLQQRKNYSKDGKLLVPENGEGVKLARIYAKKMFWGSVWQLPGILILALLHKKGMWDRIFNYGQTLAA